MTGRAEDAKYQKAVYILVGAVSIILLVVAELIHKDHEGVSAFCKELAMAGIIALIVIFTVESFTRKQHEKAANALIERINTNLFHAIYQRHIPEKVFSEVEECLMHSDIYRTQHEVMYTLTKFEEGTKGVDCMKHIKCEALSTYKISNVTDHAIDHKVIMCLERPIDGSWDDHVKVESVKIDSYMLTADQITAALSKTDSQIVFSHPIRIKEGEVVEISIEAILVKHRTDQEVWASRLPSDGIKITVNTPDKDFEVFAHANHSKKLHSEVNKENIKKWVLNHGMFPFQSVTFWWKSK